MHKGATLLSSVLLLAAAISTGHAAPQPPHAKLGIEKTYNLNPNSPREFENPFIWTAKAVCYIHTDEGTVELDVTGLKNHFKINDRDIGSGQTVAFNGYDNERFKFVAKKQARMRIVNKGAHVVKATCHLDV